MRTINSYESLLQTIKKYEYVLIYTTTPNCSVCHADLPKVERIAEDHQLPSFNVDVAAVPEAMGQLNLFSSPTVILFYKEKEFHRQARIIDFDELSYRVQQIKSSV